MRSCSASSCSGTSDHVDAQRAGALLQEPLLSQHAFHGGIAGDGFDAPHARGHAPLGDDEERSNLAGSADVRATAQLLGESGNLDHPHDVAVLLAEERHGALLDRRLIRLDLGCHRDVARNLVVDDRGDLVELVGGHPFERGEIETQPVGGHK